MVVGQGLGLESLAGDGLVVVAIVAVGHGWGWDHHCGCWARDEAGVVVIG